MKNESGAHDGHSSALRRTPLTDADLDALLTQVRRHWPELSYYETGICTLALNRVQEIAEQEGVAAITPDRLAGQREIVEEYLLPFAAVARIRELLATQPATQEPS